MGTLVCGFLMGCGEQYPGVMKPEFRGYPTTASPSFTLEPLSPAVAEGIRQYLAETVPIAFAIEENGRFFEWWRCETKCNYHLDSALGNLIYACEEMRVGSRCYIAYAGSTRSSDLEFEPVMPHGLLPAEGTEVLGPDQAHGVIVYFPGFGGWNYGYHNSHTRVDDAWIHPLYRALGGRGWDVNILKIHNQHDRAALWRNSEAYRKLTGEVVSSLRGKGYRRIVFAGSSRGGAEVLLATASAVAPDAIIVSEPNDTGGALSRDGEKDEYNDQQAEVMFARLLESDIAKTVLMYFESSFWTSGFSTYLETHPLPSSVLLVANPEGFRGHGAQGSERFVGHADCISDYLLGEVARYQECRLPAYDPADIKYWQNRDHIIAGGLQRFPVEQVAAKLSGNTACPFDWDEQRVRLDWQCTYFDVDFQLKDSGTYSDYPYNNYGEIEYADGEFCAQDGFSMYTDAECYEVFFKGNNLFTVSRREGDAWMEKILPGNQIKTHDVVCASTSKGIRCGEREHDETPERAGSRLARSMN